MSLSTYVYEEIDNKFLNKDVIITGMENEGPYEVLDVRAYRPSYSIEVLMMLRLHSDNSCTDYYGPIENVHLY